MNCALFDQSSGIRVIPGKVSPIVPFQKQWQNGNLCSKRGEMRVCSSLWEDEEGVIRTGHIGAMEEVTAALSK